MVEATNGSLAAFTVTWRDPLNRSGYFESVDTHRDYHRRGLGMALMLRGV